MTIEQEKCIRKAVECMNVAREWLDTAMYHAGTQMPESEFKKVREAYDLICKANDKL